MGIRKTDAFLTDSVDIRRADFCGAVRAKVSVTYVVGVNEDDVGLRLFFLGEKRKMQEQGSCQQQKVLYFHKTGLRIPVVKILNCKDSTAVEKKLTA
jgi:hypothetical protein